MKKKFKDVPNRYQKWDYSAPRSYFLTICTYKKKPILGTIHNGVMYLSPYGEIVKNEMARIPSYHHRIILDEWIIMPDHVHILITLGDWDYENGYCIDPGMDENRMDELGVNENGMNEHGVNEHGMNEHGMNEHGMDENGMNEHGMNEHGVNENGEGQIHEFDLKNYRKIRRRMMIPMIVGKFKMLTSKNINILANSPGTQNWQTDYHDSIVRNRHHFFHIKYYIRNNPINYEKGKRR